jgi:hypothetical protein
MTSRRSRKPLADGYSGTFGYTFSGSRHATLAQFAAI